MEGGGTPPVKERLVVDAGLELAGEVMPGASRFERLEAMAQELLASAPGDPDAAPRLDPAFRRIGPGEAERRATLESETEQWALLADVPGWPAPDVRFYETATAGEIDRRLRALARVRAGWDTMVGYYACAVKQSRLYAHLGFTSFRHYVEERLGLPPRAVEQHAAVEQRLWRSPALREARRQGVSFEKLRLLARLAHAHHIAFRSHGGGDEPENQIGLCAFHHLRCLHGGWLRVFGRAPDALTWFLGGKVWRGPGLEARIEQCS